MSAVKKIDPLAEVPLPPGSDIALAPQHVRNVLDALDRMGVPSLYRSLEAPGETPEAVAEHLGVDIDYLVLSTVYRGKATRKPAMLLHSAGTRLSDKILSALVGENMQRAESEFIQRYTGFAPDCVPPAGHLNRLPLMMDSALTRFARVWCSAGAPGCYVSVPTLMLARGVSARLVRLTN